MKIVTVGESIEKVIPIMEETKVNLRAIVDRLHQMQVVHKWWILIGVQDPKMTWPTQTEKR